MKQLVIGSMLGLALLAPATALAANWGTFEADQCTSIGERQYSAVLWNIPWWQSWESACMSTPAWINGYYFPRPDRCVHSGFNMWGEFDVPDSSCPQWGQFEADHCTSIGERQYSAVLWDIPAGYEWESACMSTPAWINGHYFPRPDRCVHSGLNMWGEFDVPDSSCPHWGDFASRCHDEGINHYSAVLWDIPPGYSWENTCANTPATVAGQYFPHPDRCTNEGVNEWGHFLVSEYCPCRVHHETWVCPAGCTLVTRNSCEVRDSPPLGCRPASYDEC